VTYRNAPLRLGEHADEMPADWLGRRASEIQDMRAAGVV
jgi:hypothetical protein